MVFMNMYARKDEHSSNHDVYLVAFIVFSGI